MLFLFAASQVQNNFLMICYQDFVDNSFLPKNVVLKWWPSPKRHVLKSSGVKKHLLNVGAKSSYPQK